MGGYSSVYSSQIDGVFTILCIFIQREPLHRPVFMHVLALTGLESLEFWGVWGLNLSKKTNKQTVECEVLALGSNELKLCF